MNNRPRPTSVRRSLAGNLAFYWGPVALLMVLIFVLSAQSSLGGWTAPAWVQALRKTGHIIEYAALGLLVARALLASPYQAEVAGREPRYRRAWWLGTVIATAYAITDELHQLFVPRRGAHLTDVVIDCLSAVAALGILYIVKTRRAAPGPRQASEPL